MEKYNLNKDNFWNNHTLNEFQHIAILKNVSLYIIYSTCFLKDGRLAIPISYEIGIFNKITFQKEISIAEKKCINYININRDGILITCLQADANLYKIKGKQYQIIQTLKPYNFLLNIIGRIDRAYSITKFLELKNGYLVFFPYHYGISFQKKNTKNNKYSNIYRHNHKGEGYLCDVCDIGNNQFAFADKYNNILQFFDMNSKKITKILQYFSFSDSTNGLILMNNKDLLVACESSIYIVDIEKKEISIGFNMIRGGFLESIYRLSNNILLVGYQNNYIEQIEYDEIKKELKIISKIYKNKDSNPIEFISLFNNDLIVAPYKNFDKKGGSLIIYKLKNK